MTAENPAPTLRPATDADLASILEMNNGALPEVSELDRDALAHLVDQSVHLVVAEVEGVVAGFLLLLEGPGRDYASLNYQWFSRRYERFLYVDRIVIGEDFRSHGLGRRLYEWAIAEGAGTWPVLCAEVNTRPRNEVSLRFHDRMGFAEVGSQDTEGGTKTVVMLARPLEQ